MKRLMMLISFAFIIGCENSVELDVIEGEVTGTVFDDSTNVPVDSVEIFIATSSVSYSQGQYYFGYTRLCSSLTNEKGRYSLVANIKRDKQYYLCASKTGYKSIGYFSYGTRIILGFSSYQQIDIRLKRN